jgi:hypothetical protein
MLIFLPIIQIENLITRKLRTGEIKLTELTRNDFHLKEKVLEALSRTLNNK